MKKIIKTTLFSIETYIDELRLPDEIDVNLELTSNESFGGEVSVFRMIGLPGDSVCHMCKFVTLRNRNNFFDGKEYFGELKLNFVDLDEGHWKLITVARCRSKATEIVYL